MHIIYVNIIFQIINAAQKQPVIGRMDGRTGRPVPPPQTLEASGRATEATLRRRAQDRTGRAQRRTRRAPPSLGCASFPLFPLFEKAPLGGFCPFPWAAPSFPLFPPEEKGAEEKKTFSRGFFLIFSSKKAPFEPHFCLCAAPSFPFFPFEAEEKRPSFRGLFCFLLKKSPFFSPFSPRG